MEITTNYFNKTFHIKFSKGNRPAIPTAASRQRTKAKEEHNEEATMQFLSQGEQERIKQGHEQRQGQGQSLSYNC